MSHHPKHPHDHEGEKHPHDDTPQDESGGPLVKPSVLERKQIIWTHSKSVAFRSDYGVRMMGDYWLHNNHSNSYTLVDQDGDILFFSTREEAEQKLEPIKRFLARTAKVDGRPKESLEEFIPDFHIHATAKGDRFFITGQECVIDPELTKSNLESWLDRVKRNRGRDGYERAPHGLWRFREYDEAARQIEAAAANTAASSKSR